MNAVQLRMARSALGLSVRDAASQVGVSPDTIVAIEASKQVKASTSDRVRVGMEKLGVIFIEENGDGPGVRLRKLRVGSRVRARDGSKLAKMAGTDPIIITELHDDHGSQPFRVTLRDEAGAVEYPGELASDVVLD